MKPITFLSLTLGATLIAGAAWAHGVLQAASPASGATLTGAPSELRLHFNEALEPKFSSVKLSDAKGAAVPVAGSEVDAADAKVIVTKLPPLPAGRYTVHWSVMTRDGHRTHGDYGFTVK